MYLTLNLVKITQEDYYLYYTNILYTFIKYQTFFHNLVSKYISKSVKHLLFIYSIQTIFIVIQKKQSFNNRLHTMPKYIFFANYICLKIYSLQIL